MGDYKTFMPVFCSAEIDLEIIEDFLRRENERNDQTGLPKTHFYLVTSEPVPGEIGDQTRAVPELKSPIEPFESPVIGKSLEELREICHSLYCELPFTFFTFAVLDERTARDKNTCEIVTHSFEPDSARCEFGLACEVLMGAEHNTSLNEGEDLDKMRDPENKNGFIYTTETWSMTPEKWRKS